MPNAKCTEAVYVAVSGTYDHGSVHLRPSQRVILQAGSGRGTDVKVIRDFLRLTCKQHSQLSVKEL